MWKKIKNNNKGMDITLIGTSWILILIVSICAILDMFVITYAKEKTIASVKSAEIYALTHNFDAANSYLNQSFNVDSIDQPSAKQEFSNLFNKYVKQNNMTYNYSYGAINIYDGSSEGKDSIYISVSDITFNVKKFIKSGTKIPFFSGNAPNYDNQSVKSSVTTKLVFYKK